MYLPKFNEQTKVAEMQQLVAKHPLGTWVIVVDGDVLINHIPFIVDPDGREFGTLFAHIARANPLSRVLENPAAISHSVVVFQGEHMFVSPSWYPSKKEHGKVVPTWNYMVVHATGKPLLKTEPEWLLRHVSEMTDRQETLHPETSLSKEAWKVADAPEDYMGSQLKGIVGVEIPVDSMVGKWKLGQNRVEVDRHSMSEQYSSCGLTEMSRGLDET